MKRVITLLLVAALSLSLCACSLLPNNKYQKYETIIDNLENGNYDTAIGLIENMAQQSGEADGETDSTEPALTPEQIAWQAKVVGTWTPSENAAKEGHTGFVIKDDGSCTVDGKACTWTIGNANETGARIDVRDGQKMAYELHISVHEDYGYKQASMNIYMDEYSIQSTMGTYYRNEDYTEVEITNDNWQDYFEVKEVIKLQENSFGEVDEFWGYTYFRLKDTCGVINSNLSSVAMEYSSVSTCQDITVDLTNKTYVPVGQVKNTSNNHSDTTLSASVDCNSERYYGTSLASFCANDVDKNTTDTVWRPMDLQIHRVLGTLYIVKN